MLMRFHLMVVEAGGDKDDNDDDDDEDDDDDDVVVIIIILLFEAVPFCFKMDGNDDNQHRTVRSRDNNHTYLSGKTNAGCGECV